MTLPVINWAHKGQTDKADLPYIAHPERVAARPSTAEAKVIGLLHDTVEDTALTVQEIEVIFGLQGNQFPPTRI